MNKLLIISIFGLMGIEVFAKDCDFLGEKLYSYSASIDRNVSYEMSVDGQVKTNLGKISVSNCRPAFEAGKSLLVTLAPLEFSLESNVSSAEYNNELRDGGCFIENNPFKDVQKFEERLENNRKKFKFINSCVDIKISHSGSGPLNIKNDQEKCKVIENSGQEAIVRGVRCQIDILSDSTFQISYSIRSECRNLEALKGFGLAPSEVITRAMIWSLENNNSPDAKLELLGSSLTRFNIEPSQTQGNLSVDLDNTGIPLYFSNYQVPDVHFGEINLKNQNALSIKLIANNRCKKYCSEGVCTSPCDYTVPFVGLFSLYQKKSNGKKVFLNEWYDGSAIPSNFQGFISLIDRNIPELREAKNGEEYFLEVALSDPKYEYQLLKNKLKGLLPPMPGIPTTSLYSNLNRGLNGLAGTGNISTIPFLGTISEFTGENNIGELSSFNGISAKGSNWPADFELICSGEKCQKISSEPFLKYLISFKISKNENQTSFENLKIERKSNILENITTTAKVTPKVKCN